MAISWPVGELAESNSGQNGLRIRSSVYFTKQQRLYIGRYIDVFRLFSPKIIKSKLKLIHKTELFNFIPTIKTYRVGPYYRRSLVFVPRALFVNTTIPPLTCRVDLQSNQGSTFTQPHCVGYSIFSPVNVTMMIALGIIYYINIYVGLGMLTIWLPVAVYYEHIVLGRTFICNCNRVEETTSEENVEQQSRKNRRKNRQERLDAVRAQQFYYVNFDDRGVLRTPFSAKPELNTWHIRHIRDILEFLELKLGSDTPVNDSQETLSHLMTYWDVTKYDFDNAVAFIENSLPYLRNYHQLKALKSNFTDNYLIDSPMVPRGIILSHETNKYYFDDDKVVRLDIIKSHVQQFMATHPNCTLSDITVSVMRKYPLDFNDLPKMFKWYSPYLHPSWYFLDDVDKDCEKLIKEQIASIHRQYEELVAYYYMREHFTEQEAIDFKVYLRTKIHACRDTHHYNSLYFNDYKTGEINDRIIRDNMRDWVFQFARHHYATVKRSKEKVKDRAYSKRRREKYMELNFEHFCNEIDDVDVQHGWTFMQRKETTYEYCTRKVTGFFRSTSRSIRNNLYEPVVDWCQDCKLNKNYVSPWYEYFKSVYTGGYATVKKSVVKTTINWVLPIIPASWLAYGADCLMSGTFKNWSITKYWQETRHAISHAFELNENGEVDQKYIKYFVEMKALAHTLYYLTQGKMFDAFGHTSYVFATRPHLVTNLLRNIVDKVGSDSLKSWLNNDQVEVEYQGRQIKLTPEQIMEIEQITSQDPNAEIDFSKYVQSTRLQDSTDDIVTSIASVLSSSFDKDIDHHDVVRANAMYQYENHKFKRLSGSIKTIMALATTISKYVFMFDPFDSKSQKHFERITDIGIIARKATVVKDTLGAHPDLCREVLQAHRDLEEEMNSFSFFQCRGFHTIRIREIEKMLLAVVPIAQATIDGNRRRKEPVSVLLTGRAGTGKSSVLNALLELVYARWHKDSNGNPKKMQQCDVYKKAPTSQFWSQYYGQWAVLLDDALTTTSQDVNLLEVLDIVKMINVAPFYPDMPFENKGLVEFNSDLVCMSTNLFNAGIHNTKKNDLLPLRDPDAFTRRCHIIAHFDERVIDVKDKLGVVMKHPKDNKYYLVSYEDYTKHANKDANGEACDTATFLSTFGTVTQHSVPPGHISEVLWCRVDQAKGAERWVGRFVKAPVLAQILSEAKETMDAQHVASEISVDWITAQNSIKYSPDEFEEKPIENVEAKESRSCDRKYGPESNFKHKFKDAKKKAHDVMQKAERISKHKDDVVPVTRTNTESSETKEERVSDKPSHTYDTGFTYLNKLVDAGMFDDCPYFTVYLIPLFGTLLAIFLMYGTYCFVQHFMHDDEKTQTHSHDSVADVRDGQTYGRKKKKYSNSDNRRSVFNGEMTTYGYRSTADYVIRQPKGVKLQSNVTEEYGDLTEAELRMIESMNTDLYSNMFDNTTLYANTKAKLMENVKRIGGSRIDTDGKRITHDCCIIYICDGWWLTAAHFFNHFYPYQDSLLIYDGPNGRKSVPFPSSCFKFRHQDAVVFQMPKDFPLGKDISSLFPSLTEIMYLQAGSPTEVISVSSTQVPFSRKAALMDNHAAIFYPDEAGGENFFMEMTHRYHANTFAGDSGGLVIAQGISGRAIPIGMHLGYCHKTKSCFALPLTEIFLLNLQEALKDYTNPMKQNNNKPTLQHGDTGYASLLERFDPIPVNYKLGPLDVLCAVPDDKKTFLSRHNKISENILYGWDGKPHRRPNASTVLKKGPHAGVDPLHKALTKFQQENFIDSNNCDFSPGVRSLLSIYGRDPEVKSFVKVFDIDTATNGYIVDDFHMKPMDITTASGYPFCNTDMYPTQGPRQGKVPFITKEVDDASNYKLVVSDIMKREVNERVTMAKRGERKPCLYQVFIKNETRPIAKVESGDSRIVSCGPTDSTITNRMYFGCVSAIVEAWNGPLKMGINPHSAEWTQMRTSMYFETGCVVAGDFKKFDGKVPRFVGEAALDFINKLYRKDERNPTEQEKEDELVRKILFEDIYDAYYICEHNIFNVKDGNPSGNAITTLYNSLCNYLMLYLVCTKDLDLRDCEFKIAVYGDDNVISFAKPNITIAMLAPHLLRRFGMTYTASTKLEEDAIKVTTWDEITFLGRSFVLGSDGLYRAPLDLRRIIEIPYWFKGSNASKASVTLNCIISMLIELGHHRYEVASEVVERMLKWIDKMQLKNNLRESITISVRKYNWQSVQDMMYHSTGSIVSVGKEDEHYMM